VPPGRAWLGAIASLLRVPLTRFLVVASRRREILLNSSGALMLGSILSLRHARSARAACGTPGRPAPGRAHRPLRF
jgi:hypothetical protein